MKTYYRPSHQRGGANYGWLDTKYTFSFSEYYDPKHMGFSVLRVINDDIISGGGGFPLHPHKNMEIITFIMDGAIEHQDSTGRQTVVRPGEIQIMSAGSGIQHQEFNHYKDRNTHLLQIWILPHKKEVAPRYDQIQYQAQEGQLTKIVASIDDKVATSNDAQPLCTYIYQDLDLYVLKSATKGTLSFKSHKKSLRCIWIQLLKGFLDVHGQHLAPGDGLGLSEFEDLGLSWGDQTEFLLFDLPDLTAE